MFSRSGTRVWDVQLFTPPGEESTLGTEQGRPEAPVYAHISNFDNHGVLQEVVVQPACAKAGRMGLP